MKRSKINKVIEDGIKFIDEMHFSLPDFAFWKPEDFKGKKAEYDEVFTNMLGWDVTDFGYDDFENVGLLIFTIRNGSIKHPDIYPKPYCEKYLIVEEGQKLAPHYHYQKWKISLTVPAERQLLHYGKRMKMIAFPINRLR